MTRTAAILLSYFGSTVPGIFLLLFFASFESEPPVVLMVVVAVAVVIAALFIRVYFAMWYVRDKCRSSVLGLLALLGSLGWLLLIMTEDRKRVEPDPVGATPVAI